MAGSISDAERHELIRDLKSKLPEGVNAEDLLGGELAGPVSDDRPPVPVWEYAVYAAQQGRGLADLARYRFPILSYDGTTTIIVSLHEMAASGPAIHTPTYDVTYSEVVRLLQIMYENGALLWNPKTRGHEEILPSSQYRQAAYREWQRGLLPSSQD